MNIKDTLADAASSLAKAGVPDPRREARTLLAFALGRQTAFLFAHPEYDLSDDESVKYAEVVGRRAAREPYHLIVGTREFYGREFLVEKGVLAPRPETEILVEQAVALLSTKMSPSFFEVGVGTGCISVSILKELPEALGDAVDISEQALDLAWRNAARFEVTERFGLRQADLFEGALGEYDLIVSNPPYIPNRDRDRLAPEVFDFDPPSALFSGRDGLDLIRRVVNEAPYHLKQDSYLLLEIGAGQAAQVQDLFDTASWSEWEFLADLQGIARVVRAKRRS